MELRRVMAAVIGLIVVSVLGLFLAAWFAPSGPSIDGTIGSSGFYRGYVGNHYSVWSELGISHSFVATNAQVDVTGAGCQGRVRLVGPPVAGGYLAGVAAGPLPGESIIGRRLTPQMGPRLAVVLTGSTVGRCRVKEVRVAAHSWWRDRWTTVPGDFSVDVTHRSGVDPRTKEAAPPAL